jgi:L-malate glycosyltransferase
MRSLESRCEETRDYFGIAKNLNDNKTPISLLTKSSKYPIIESRIPALYALVRRVIRSFYLKKSMRSLQSTLKYNPRKYWSFRESIKKSFDVSIVSMHWLQPGGAEEFAIESLKAIRAQIKHNLILTIDIPAEQKFLDRIPEDVYILPIYTPEGRKVLDHIIKESQIHFLHINHSTHIYSELPKIRWHSPSVVIVDSLHILESGTGGFVHQSLLNSEFIDYTHVISRSLKEYIYSYDYAIGRRPTVLVSYLVNDGWSVAVKPKCDLQSERLRFGFIGRLTTQKQPELFISLCKKLSKKYETAEFHIYGDGEKLSSMEELSRKLGVKIIFHGHEPDRSKIFESIDILILTSENEGLALVVYEALANGVWVFSMNVGAQSEIIPNTQLINPSSLNFYRTFMKKFGALKKSANLREYSWNYSVESGEQIKLKNWSKYLSGIIGKIE